MTARKLPVLLRRGGLTGHVMALTNYRRQGDGPIVAAPNGKHDVIDDFNALVVETLLDGLPDNLQPNLVAIACGVKVTGKPLDAIGLFADRLGAIVTANNERIDREAKG